VPGHVQIGTRMLGRAEADVGDGPGRAPGAEPAGEPRGDGPARGDADRGEARGGEYSAARPPGADGTLLAVVPIPGTGTSLAIVGYPVTAPESGLAVAVPLGPIPEVLVRAGQVLAGAVLAGPGAGDRSAGERPGLLLDHEQRRVLVDGAEVTLTFQEFELLAFLAAHPATVFSRADLVRKVWQRDFTADSRTVDVHVSRLRRKLGPAYGRCLVTEYRVGYQFRPATS
jgi:Transcriptional regulatory protein, C terminal